MVYICRNMPRPRTAGNDFPQTRADRILQNSMKINRQNELKQGQEKVMAWLDDGHHLRRSNRRRVEPSWYKLYLNEGTKKLQV